MLRLQKRFEAALKPPPHAMSLKQRLVKLEICEIAKLQAYFTDQKVPMGAFSKDAGKYEE